MTDRHDEAPLSEWETVVARFHAIFDGLGEVTQDPEQIAFATRPPDVATGIAIRRDGRIGASMPLHDVEARIDRIRRDASYAWIELVGEGLAYTYRIPPEVLRHRPQRS